MTIDNTNTVWADSIVLNEHHTLSFEELIALSGLSQSELQQLVENGVLIPEHLIDTSLNNTNVKTNINAWHFSSHHLVSIRQLSRLKRDFELESNSLSLIMVFIERIRKLEMQLQHLDRSN